MKKPLGMNTANNAKNFIEADETVSEGKVKSAYDPTGP